MINKQMAKLKSFENSTHKKESIPIISGRSSSMVYKFYGVDINELNKEKLKEALIFCCNEIHYLRTGKIKKR